MRFTLFTAATATALQTGREGATQVVAEQGKGRFRKLLDEYDARDADGFAFVIVQAITVIGLEGLSRTLGIPAKTVERWSTRASTPPYLTRAAAIHIIADALDRGPSKTEDEKRALVRRVQTQVEADLDHSRGQPAFIAAMPRLAVNNDALDAR